jgi:hypothetical protein
MSKLSNNDRNRTKESRYLKNEKLEADTPIW